jgi:hypothetical protein
MNLVDTELELFFKLWYTLIWGINKKQKIVPKFKKPLYGQQINTESLIAVRTKMWENPNWIDDFLRGSASRDLNDRERTIIRHWREKFIKDRFIVIKHLKKHSVFMSFAAPTKLYGVLGINDLSQETAAYKAPFMVETVLLPFQDKIIHDGFLFLFDVQFSKDEKDNIFKKTYQEIKTTDGIIETIGTAPVPAKKSKPAKTAAPPPEKAASK